MLLARNSDLPPDMTPAESQWNKLISVCAGVLATSPFGTIITKYAEICRASISTDPSQILDWVLALNDRTSRMLSGDAPFLAALAEWFFGINVAIETEKGTTGNSNGQSQLTLKSTASELATAGRVQWNSVFRTAFGQAWRELSKETLTAIIACASGLTHNSLVNSGRDPRTFFLRHEVGMPHLDGFGMNETIIACSTNCAGSLRGSLATTKLIMAPRIYQKISINTCENSRQNANARAVVTGRQKFAR